MADDDDDDTDEDALAHLYHESGNVRDGPGMGDNSGLEPDDTLDDLDFNDIAREGRKLLILDLVKAVKQGIATPAEKNTLRQMLKDNGLVMGDPNEGAPQGGQKREKLPLPSFSEPDYSR